MIEKKKNLLFNWLAKGTRAEPWPSASEIINSKEYKELQKIGKKLVEDSKKKVNQ